ncbi:MAG TPA: sodium-independent anion transporter [Vicinamibacterales bacterium]|nr:sodium-independent anion transporter [Vicinamibacterales bacterium]
MARHVCVSTLTSQIKDMSPVVILRLRNMTAVDATGLRAMQEFADAVHASGRVLLLYGAPPQPARLMARAEFHRHVGAENILPNVESALARAIELRRAHSVTAKSGQLFALTRHEEPGRAHG